MTIRLPRRRKLGLTLTVHHPDSMIEDRAHFERDADSDGHFVAWHMTSMPKEFLLDLQIRQGMAAPEAASILRKLADRIERDGTEFLAQPGGTSGEYNKEGVAMRDGLQALDGEEFWIESGE